MKFEVKSILICMVTSFRGRVSTHFHTLGSAGGPPVFGHLGRVQRDTSSADFNAQAGWGGVSWYLKQFAHRKAFMQIV